MKFAKRSPIGLTLGIVLIVNCASAEDVANHLPRGAVLVFYGDSITARGDDAGGWITMLRHEFARNLGRPDVRLINAGRGGAVAADLLALLQRSFPRRPQVAVVGIGINDALRDKRGLEGNGVEDYQTMVRQIIRRLVREGARVLVWSPLVFGERERGSNPGDDLIDAYAQAAELAAEAENARFVDARSAFFEGRSAKSSDAASLEPWTVDGLHLSVAGNNFLAELIFTELMDFVSDGP